MTLVFIQFLSVHSSATDRHISSEKITCLYCVWVLYLYCRFMDDQSYVGPQGLHRPNANPINCLSAYRWWNDFPLPFAMHATITRAINVIWCSFIPYHMLLSDQTLYKERRKGLGTSLHSSCPPQTAIIHGSLTDTMHTIATVLLIAPLNFCHTVTRNKA